MKMTDKLEDDRPREKLSDREVFLAKWQKIEDAVITRAHMTDNFRKLRSSQNAPRLRLTRQ